MVFGIDGGGTKSRITVLDAADVILYEGFGDSTNVYSVGIEIVKQNISVLISEMLSSLQLQPKAFLAGCFGSAGLDSPEEKVVFQDFFSQVLHFSCPLVFCNDSLPALVGGHGKTEGIILIAGTGAIACGLKRDGSIVRAGGWGHILGDEGSGYWIGCQGLIKGIHSFENRDLDSILPNRIRSFYSVHSFRDLFSFVYNNFDKAKIASFSEIVFEEARAGDILCNQILDSAVVYLSKLCESVFQRFGEDSSCDVVFSGGILENEPMFCEKIRKTCIKHVPNMTFVERKFYPAYGACLLAKGYVNNQEIFNSKLGLSN